ncbi:DNA-binding response regulator [Candidatus Saccharibacteria bacterium RIFCSPHIGHO2_01_FULL_46_30]|nr:MAG: DNA-binding response regulator [Candidatus Saccharibacteria bacterium RIFCSPHIGHO2_01_FULL_46_30]
MRLLVIEDESRIAQAIRRALQLHHYAVDVVSDSDSGVAAAADADYDLVILDRMLPGSLDGIGICQQVRQRGVSTPIIMLTALGEVNDRITGLRAGADDYLQKPFAMKELIARVEALLRRPRVTLGTSLTVSDLSYDPATFTATRGEKALMLSAKEIKLLAYLLYNQGKVISKDTIIAHVWDGDAIIVPNTVEVYIGYLRRKIDTAFPDKPPLIHTVRGFGYRLGEV